MRTPGRAALALSCARAATPRKATKGSIRRHRQTIEDLIWIETMRSEPRAMHSAVTGAARDGERWQAYEALVLVAYAVADGIESRVR